MPLLLRNPLLSPFIWLELGCLLFCVSGMLSVPLRRRLFSLPLFPAQFAGLCGFPVSQSCQKMFPDSTGSLKFTVFGL